jgi:hypothetical protein
VKAQALVRYQCQILYRGSSSASLDEFRNSTASFKTLLIIHDHFLISFEASGYRGCGSNGIINKLKHQEFYLLRYNAVKSVEIHRRFGGTCRYPGRFFITMKHEQYSI